MEEASDGVGALVQLLAETAKLNLNEQVLKGHLPRVINRTTSLERKDEKFERKSSGEKVLRNRPGGNPGAKR